MGQTFQSGLRPTNGDVSCVTPAQHSNAEQESFSTLNYLAVPRQSCSLIRQCGVSSWTLKIWKKYCTEIPKKTTKKTKMTLRRFWLLTPFVLAPSFRPIPEGCKMVLKRMRIFGRVGCDIGQARKARILFADVPKPNNAHQNGFRNFALGHKRFCVRPKRKTGLRVFFCCTISRIIFQFIRKTTKKENQNDSSAQPNSAEPCCQKITPK